MRDWFDSYAESGKPCRHFGDGRAGLRLREVRASVCEQIGGLDARERRGGMAYDFHLEVVNGHAPFWRVGAH